MIRDRRATAADGKGVVRQGNVDLDASRRSIEVAQRLERHRGATIWLHHDLDAQRFVQTAPSFYA